MKVRLPHQNTPRTSAVKEIADEIAKKAANREIYRQILERDRQFQRENDAMFLWAAHEFLRVGTDRLKRFYRYLFTRHEELRNYYDLDPDDEGWIYSQKLKGIGFDIDEETRKIQEEKGE